MKITDEDIATVEKLHDLLIDGHDYPLHHPLLKKSRDLTKRMYKDVIINRIKKNNETRRNCLPGYYEPGI